MARNVMRNNETMLVRQVLRAMARSTGPAVRRRFYQLRVMDLLVRELSLEYEAALQARLPPAPGRLASAASGGTDFLSSPSRPGAPQGGSSSYQMLCLTSHPLLPR